MPLECENRPPGGPSIPLVGGRGRRGGAVVDLNSVFFVFFVLLYIVYIVYIVYILLELAVTLIILGKF